MEKAPRSDRYWSSLLWQSIRETKAAVAESSAKIAWTREAIALLNRLNTGKRPSDGAANASPLLTSINARSVRVRHAPRPSGSKAIPLSARLLHVDLTLECKYCGRSITKIGKWFRVAHRFTCVGCKREVPIGYSDKVALFKKHAQLLETGGTGVAPAESAAPSATTAPGSREARSRL